MSVNSVVVTETQFSGFPVRRGKVREVYELGERLLIVATLRTDSFDIVLAREMPDSDYRRYLLSILDGASRGPAR